MRIFAADFETTVYKGQIDTEVWCACVCELGANDPIIMHSIADFFKWIKSQRCHMRIYFHNLKFDGEFIISYIMRVLKLESIVTENGNLQNPKPGEFTYSISSKGLFYRILINFRGMKIDIRDSYKILPYSLERLGKSFGTKHKKLKMEYAGFRYAGCPITPEEERYIKNDVYVLKEALEIFFSAGHNSLTIGSCCIKEYKKSRNYDASYFPNMYDIELDDSFGSKTAGEYIRRSYYGGWCYVVEEMRGKMVTNGVTVDANSLYPSNMHSESGNRYPVGKPTFFKGKPPANLLDLGFYYFIRIKCQFQLKEGYLPFIQIKNSPLYKANEMLKTSDVYNRFDGKYYHWLETENGFEEVYVILTLTCTDFIRFLEFYDVQYECLDGCYFSTEIGIFDDYLNHYRKQKENSKGAVREEAKLFSNNLYGKMATSTDSSYKVAYLDEDDIVRYNIIKEEHKKPGYIPIGSAITSYSRNETIRRAQANYHPGEPGFIMADTDSMHCNISKEELINVPLHDTKYGFWKVESEWKVGLFVRQKAYIESDLTLEEISNLNVDLNDEDAVLKIFRNINVKCAGMPDTCKLYFIRGLLGDTTKINSPKKQKLELSDFTYGLSIQGKLHPKRYPGGIVLEETDFTIHKHLWGVL